MFKNADEVAKKLRDGGNARRRALYLSDPYKRKINKQAAFCSIMQARDLRRGAQIAEQVYDYYVFVLMNERAERARISLLPKVNYYHLLTQG